MNKIRLITFVTGSLLILTGVAKIMLASFVDENVPIYTSVVLITIGGILILAVRRK